MTSRHPPSRPASPTPFARRPSVSTHQPPPSTPSFASYPQPISRPADNISREFPRDAPKGPKALCNNNNNNNSSLPSSSAATTPSSAHSPHKSNFTFPLTQQQSSHHYAPPGSGVPPAPRGPVGSVGGSSYTPSGPRGGTGRGGGSGGSGGSVGANRSPVTSTAPGGSGHPAPLGGPFGSGYVPEGDRYRGSSRRRSGDWSDSLRGGRGRSRERDYSDYGSSRGSVDHGRGGFGSRFNDRERDFDRGRDFRDGRGGYYGHRPRSPSRERDRISPYGLGRGDRDRHDRGLGFIGDRRPDRERDRERELRDREREREKEREVRERELRERERERETRETRERDPRFPPAPRPIPVLPAAAAAAAAVRDIRERTRGSETREFHGPVDSSQADRDRIKRERDAAE